MGNENGSLCAGQRAENPNRTPLNLKDYRGAGDALKMGADGSVSADGTVTDPKQEEEDRTAYNIAKRRQSWATPSSREGGGRMGSRKLSKAATLDPHQREGERQLGELFKAGYKYYDAHKCQEAIAKFEGALRVARQYSKEAASDKVSKQGKQADIRGGAGVDFSSSSSRTAAGGRGGGGGGGGGTRERGQEHRQMLWNAADTISPACACFFFRSPCSPPDTPPPLPPTPPHTRPSSSSFTRWPCQVKLRFRSYEGRALGNLASTYEYLCRYQEALDSYEPCLEIMREIGDREKEIKVLNNMGVATLSLNNFEKSLEYHKQMYERMQEPPAFSAHRLRQVQKRLRLIKDKIDSPLAAAGASPASSKSPASAATSPNTANTSVESAPA